jgi:hypothetical protein
MQLLNTRVSCYYILNISDSNENFPRMNNILVEGGTWVNLMLVDLALEETLLASYCNRGEPLVY